MFAGWLALLPAGAGAETDVHWGLPELMAQLAQVRSGESHFVERKYLQVMTEPLQSSGTLSYTAPGRLEKRTLLPQPGGLLISGDEVRISRGSTSRRISLRDTPEISALVSGLRATMAGDGVTLARFYTTSLQGNATDWRLDLVPLDPRMRTLVARIRITGRWSALSGVVTEEPNGDRTETIITPDTP